MASICIKVNLGMLFACDMDGPSQILQSCICGHKFEVDHTLSCKRGGFVIQRHNDLRDFAASLLTEVCHNVAVEPSLQPLNGENFLYRSANTDSEARLDVKARGFWNRGQDAFFDARVFNPYAPMYRSLDLPQLYRRHEQEKKREYNQRVLEVENGVFTPLIFSTSGGMGRSEHGILQEACLLYTCQGKETCLIQ